MVARCLSSVRNAIPIFTGSAAGLVVTAFRRLIVSRRQNGHTGPFCLRLSAAVNINNLIESRLEKTAVRLKKPTHGSTNRFNATFAGSGTEVPRYRASRQSPLITLTAGLGSLQVISFAPMAMAERTVSSSSQHQTHGSICRSVSHFTHSSVSSPVSTPTA